MSESTLQWGRDDGVAEDIDDRAVELLGRRFNGAATMGSRKTSTRDGRSPKSRLQWGRDDGVAEDAAIRRPSSHLDALQWGRDDGVAEDVDSSVECTRVPMSFNGAATMGSRKTQCRRRLCRWRMPLQWGRDDGVAEDSRDAGQRSRPA